ncbi:MAG TPA: ABC transporter permease [Candidatus Corynebacterium avicola]|uniref:ABC transporter permease n=1 Tax=Candidatus Corynebacterium avicola TaxID=2838527 RepID=A0A9D1RRE0_9CORY|nr:ABC transporter permease [Candidatus Corynebacterium avicola]
MKTYLLKRLPSALAVIVVGSIVVFALLRLVPGDPAASLAGSDATPEAVAAIREELGLNASPISQYFSWIGDILTFNLGQSLVIGGDIASLITESLGRTVLLTVTAVVFAVILALLFSVGAELINRRWAHSVTTAFATLGVAVPTFVTGTVAIILFGVVFIVLPAGGVPRDGLLARPDITFQYLLLPALCLSLPAAAALTRFLSNSIQAELGQPYVTTARAVGVSRRRILLTQVLPNALPPAVTVLGLQIGQLLGGALIIEALFAWPGVGYLVQQAVAQRDYPVVQVVLLLSVVLFVIIQLLTDLIHSTLDPRIRLEGAR